MPAGYFPRTPFSAPRARSIALPAGTLWGDTVAATTPGGKVDLGFLAVGAERAWIVAGTSRPAPKAR